MRADSEERDGKIKTLKAREKNIIENKTKQKQKEEENSHLPLNGKVQEKCNGSKRMTEKL